MTQQDKERDAFEAFARKEGWPLERYNPGYFMGDSEGEYKFVQETWKAWQAARYHDAPKLTEKEALETAGTAIAEEMALIPRGTPWEEGSDRLVRAAIKSLRAAGVRFKEET